MGGSTALTRIRSWRVRRGHPLLGMRASTLTLWFAGFPPAATSRRIPVAGCDSRVLRFLLIPATCESFWPLLVSQGLGASVDKAHRGAFDTDRS